MKPLRDLRVIDLSRILAGPWCAQILADMGADVIKVERAGVGDDARGWGPPFVKDANGENIDATYFHAANRGKRSITIDFDNPADLDVVRRLIAGADIVIENFKVGGLKKYGLDYKTLSAAHPRLVYCSVTGFGQTGPYAKRPGYDAMIQAIGGLMHITGDPDGEPTKAGLPLADIMTGIYAAVAVLSAILNRNATGEGAYIDMSLLDTQVGVLANQGLSHLIAGLEPARLGNAHPNLVPYQVFPTADGEMMIAVGNDEQFKRLCGVLRAPELGTDADYLRNADRVRNRKQLVAIISGLTARRKKADLQSEIEAAGIPAGPINTISEVFADPQVRHRGMRVDLPYPGRAEGTVPTVRTPVLMNGEPCVAERASPRLGEHTQEILDELAETGRAERIAGRRGA
ncbi:MAG: CaiB/BaiF CoA transferase family protein [Rhodospirillaceae bacterium]